MNPYSGTSALAKVRGSTRMGSSALQAGVCLPPAPYRPPALRRRHPTAPPPLPCRFLLQVLRFSAVGAGLVYGAIKMSVYKVRCMQGSRPAPASAQRVCQPQQSWVAGHWASAALPRPVYPPPVCAVTFPAMLRAPLLCLLALCRARQQRRQSRRTTDCSLAGEQQLQHPCNPRPLVVCLLVRLRSPVFPPPLRLSLYAPSRPSAAFPLASVNQS